MARKFDLQLVLSAVNKASAQLKDTRDWMQKNDAQIKALGAAFVAFGAVAVTGLSIAIKKASDLQEVQSKFDTVFKEQAVLAEEWATVLQAAFAMSETEAKKNLSAIQDLLVPMGVARDTASELSFEIVKLSADLGSFNNLPTEQVMLDIQSAIVGNFETMKKYGVVLNATKVQQEALNQGLAGSANELTQADKAMAAYSLIVKGTGDAIGDMERTQASFANQMKFFRAQINDIITIFGKNFLPTVTKLFVIINTALLPAIKNWVSETKNIDNIMTKLLKTISIGSKLVLGLSAAVDLASIGLVTFAADLLGLEKDGTVGFEAIKQKIEEYGEKFKVVSMENLEAFATTNAAIAEDSTRTLDVVSENLDLLLEKQRENDALATENFKNNLAQRLKFQLDWLKIVTDLINNFTKATAAGFNHMFLNIGKGWDELGKGLTKIMVGIRNAIVAQISNIAAEWVVKVGVMKAASLAWGAVVWAVNQAAAAAKVIAGWATIPFVGAALGIAAAGALISQMGAFKGFANGVRGFGGGLAMINEREGELVNLPTGTDVFTGTESRGILNGMKGGGANKIINLNIDFSNSVFTGTLDEITNMVSTQIMNDLRLQANIS